MISLLLQLKLEDPFSDDRESTPLSGQQVDIPIEYCSFTRNKIRSDKVVEAQSTQKVTI